GDLPDGVTPYSLLEWNGVSWSAPTVAGPLPPGAAFPAIAYDMERRQVVVFGGVCAGACPGGSGPVLLDATWEYDGAWQLRTPAHRPAARAHAAMAYDRARRCIVLVGGRDAAGQLLPETWEYDGIDWLQRASVHTAPAGFATYDPVRHRVVLVGGGETWEWDGQDWTPRLLAAAPQHPWGIVYDEARQRVVVYSASGTDNGMWEWDGASSQWTARLDQQGPLPEWSIGMTYDLTRTQVVWINSLDMGPDVGRGTLVYEPVQAARYLPFGNRCTSSANAPDLRAAPWHLPWLGDTFAVDLTGLPPGNPPVFLVSGVQAIPPVELSAFGLPGCFQYLQPLTAALLPTTGGAARWSVAIPNSTGLVGVSFYNQALIIDPNAVGGATVSNAGAGTIGSR
ncbi:MAG TPA: hypothetical protein VK348_03185, partial [Planctomycetota bacterium]|nr:hypothetical protein [Planctomycetota bacterium]